MSSQNAASTTKKNRSIQGHSRFLFFLTRHLDKIPWDSSSTWWKHRLKNKLREKEILGQLVDVSVSLERGREDGEGDTLGLVFFVCRVTCVTVFQPTEIRTNTGSVSYPKVEKEQNEIKIYQRSQDKSQGMTEISRRDRRGWMRACSMSPDDAEDAAATVEHSGRCCCCCCCCWTVRVCELVCVFHR